MNSLFLYLLVCKVNKPQVYRLRSGRSTPSRRMWSYGLDSRSIRFAVVKVVVSSEGTCNNCLFVEVFKLFFEV